MVLNGFYDCQMFALLGFPVFFGVPVILLVRIDHLFEIIYYKRLQTTQKTVIGYG
jgi:hypothetical protein